MGVRKGCSLILHQREQANLQTTLDHSWRCGLPILCSLNKRELSEKPEAKAQCAFQKEGRTRSVIWEHHLQVSLLPHSSVSNGREWELGQLNLAINPQIALNPPQGSLAVPKCAGPPNVLKQQEDSSSRLAVGTDGGKNKPRGFISSKSPLGKPSLVLFSFCT